MLKNLRTLAMVGLALACVAAAPLAKADGTFNVDNVSLTFASGAAFTGTVDFAIDYSSVAGVSGVLSDYEDGISGFTGTGSDSINWVWGLCGNCSGLSGDQYGTFLMDGTPDGSGFGVYSNLIAFTYDYSGAPNLLLDSGGYGVAVDYVDPLVSGSVTYSYTTPEPGTILLFGSGLAGLALMARRRTLRRA